MTQIHLGSNISKTAGDRPMLSLINVHVDSLLWGSTVGYSSDSLASCCDICLSVTYIAYHSFTQYWSVVESSYFVFLGRLLFSLANGQVILRPNGQRSRSLRTKMQRSFCAYFRETWIDLHQSNTKMIFGPFYTYRQIHFTSKNVNF